MKSELHSLLQRESIYWLYKNGCEFFVDEVGFKGEILDAVGIKKSGDTMIVETKATKGDLEKARQEYRFGNFDFQYLLIPKDFLQYVKVGQWAGWGVIVFIKTESGGYIESVIKAKRQDRTSHFVDWIDLMFEVSGKLAREKYFDNFRGNYDE